MRITWLGHATVLLEIDGAQLITDPILRDRVGPLVRVSKPVAMSALSSVDAVLLSHLHADHTDPRSLRALGRSVPILAPRPAARWLRGVGLDRVSELSVGEEALTAGMRVRATAATHDGRRRPFGPSGAAIGYLIGEQRGVYFAGDTDLFPAMAELRGSVSVALVPVWGWGRSLGPDHLDPDRAAQAVALIAPQAAIPIHWGTLAPAWQAKRATDRERPARQFASLTAQYAPGVRVCLLSPGDQTEL